jgi:tRNA-specific 2-thiouridylase
LGIPFYALNFEKDFGRIIDYFADEYVRGRTPNPCVVCNSDLKFGKIVDYADAVGARYVATGHYARIGERNGRKVLLRAMDERKDQSYVLFGLNRKLLDRVLFPVGHLEKSEVRRIAARFDLPNRDKPDSVEICFVPDRDYARVVRQRRPEAFAEGDVVDAAGRVLGRHAGLPHYTIGQRRGLRIAAGVPIYVTALDTAANTVTVGRDEELDRSELIAEGVNFLVDGRDAPGTRFRAEVKIRYLHRAAPATVEVLPHSRIRVAFDQPQRAVTPGQAAAMYDEDILLGGGWIRR